jgi:hypothetical protein
MRQHPTPAAPRTSFHPPDPERSPCDDARVTP